MKVDGNKNRGTYESSGYNATKAIGRAIDKERRDPKGQKIQGVGRTDWYLGRMNPAEIEKYIKSGKNSAPTRAQGGVNIYKSYKAKAEMDIANREWDRKRLEKAAQRKTNKK